MTGLFDDQTLEYFCSHQTKNEIKQLTAWSSNEIDKKIQPVTNKDTKRFLSFVRLQVIEFLKLILNGNGDNGDGNFFVEYYTRLWKLCNTNKEKTDGDTAAREQLISQIQQREEKRLLFLQKYMQEPKITDFIEWFEKDSKNCGSEFNMIVAAFTEQLTQTILSKAVNYLLFPNKTAFIN